MNSINKNTQYYKFCFYGFLKNLRFFEAFFILFLIEKGLTFTQIGILYALREITINLFEIPSGIVADAYGRKKALLGSFIAYMISFTIYYMASGFWIFSVAFVLYGVGDAFRTGTHKAMIMDFLKLNGWEDQKIAYYGHTRSWSQKGSAVSSLIAGLIVFYSGSYQLIFLFSIFPYLLNFLLVLSYPGDLNYSSEQKPKESKTAFLESVKYFFKAVKQPVVLRIINTSALHSAFLKAVKDYIQPLMVSVALLIPIMSQIDQEKKNGVVIGIIYFLIYLATSYASKAASGIARKHSSRISVVTLLLGFLMGIITGIFYYFQFPVIALLAFVGIYIIENLRKPILTGFVADNVSNENLTSVLSAQSQWETLLAAAIAVVLGFLADTLGIGISFVIIASVLAFFTLFFAFRQKQITRRF